MGLCRPHTTVERTMGWEGESIACVDSSSWRSWALALTPVPVANVSSLEDTHSLGREL